jgi:hypothetical protein
MNKNFGKAKNTKEFRRWLIRQYFNPNKNTQDVWFDSVVDESNVLAYISECKNNFPLTPMQIVNMWNTIYSFKKDYKKSQKEFDAYVLEEDKETDVRLKKPGQMEYTLEEIGKTLGGITATMINRLSNTGMAKFKTLTFDTPFGEMSTEVDNLHRQAIQTYRDRAADKYITALKESKGDLNNFFAFIASTQVMTEKEIQLVLPMEFDAILLLSSLDEEDIREFLLDDISRNPNIVTSYQCMVAKQAFPTKKRGRPRKIVA